MIPILTPEELRALDAEAPEPLEVLIGRAGAAVARHALDLLGGAYGRRVVVIAGKGNNGADGREAARLLRRRGVRVAIVDPADGLGTVPPCDLVVDAAYGTGFRGTWEPPSPGGAPVLAVDIPSGVDASTGVAAGAVLAAVRTVTFAALKPGLVQGRGPELAGDVVVADIGLDPSRARAHLVEDADVAAWLPERDRDSHKWRAAVWVIAGSPGMTGAAALAASAALRAGAGYARLSVPGGSPGEDAPIEVVGWPLPPSGWADEVVGGLDRFRAAVVGPGLGRGADEDVRRAVAAAPVPVVVDGDGLTALGADVADVVTPSTVLTPHAGEYERLTGRAPADDRLAASRVLAATAGCTVLLKGSTTAVAGPDGEVLVVTAGDARLATAGTGDVLSGIVAALLALGLPPVRSAAAAAHVHGRAGRLGPARGLVAGDLVDLLPAAFVLGGLMTGEIPVRDVMTTDVLTFRPDEQVEHAYARLTERGVDGGPVIDDDGHVVGMLTTDDLLVQETKLHYPTVLSILGAYVELPSSHRKFEQELRKAVAARVADAMSSRVDACAPDDSLQRAATLMHTHDVSRLPVTEGGRLVGIVARGDILRAVMGA